MLKSESRNIRLVTFAPGTVFGELAVLDKGPRSASIFADEDVVAYSLSETDFAALREREPAVAIKILAGLGRGAERPLAPRESDDSPARGVNAHRLALDRTGPNYTTCAARAEVAREASSSVR